jgi:hypothetical protein
MNNAQRMLCMHRRYLALLWGAAIFEAGSAKDGSSGTGLTAAGLRAQKHYDTFSLHISKNAKVIIPVEQSPPSSKAEVAAATNQAPRHHWWGFRGQRRNPSRATAPASTTSISGDVVKQWDTQWEGGGHGALKDGLRGARGRGKGGRLGTDGKGRSMSALDLAAPLYASTSMSPGGGSGGAHTVVIRPCVAPICDKHSCCF